MKGYVKALATAAILLAAMLVIVIIFSLLFPNLDADYEKMGSSFAVIVIAIAFGMAIKGTIGKKETKNESKESSGSDT